MDATRALLTEIAERFGWRVVLWRGPRLGGADVDLLALPGVEAELADVLWRAGLRPAPGDAGHVVWSGHEVTPLDVLAARAWRAAHPSLAGLVARLVETDLGPPAASGADRALICAAEAVAGRPLEKVSTRAREALAEPGAPEQLRAVAAQEGLEQLGGLVADPDALAGLARRGRLPYGRALALAVRCPPARSALRGRVASRLARSLPRGLCPPLAMRSPKPLLITVSGMDGAGKSTACRLVQDHLQRRGRPAEIAWARLGAESELLDRLGSPVKRRLRRSGTIADPVAAGGPGVAKTRDPREGRGRRRPVSWAWIVVVALVNARSYRRAAARRRAGIDVVCDRWTTDGVVDLRLRYGGHPVAERLLRLATPRRALGILLEIDARTALERKPDDQAPHILEAMESAYALRAQREPVVVIDARLPLAEVDRRLRAAIDGLDRGTRGSRRGRRG